MDVFSTVGAVCVGILLGGMVFFPSVVAPNVFRALDEENGGKFLRQLFPAYYVFIIVFSAVGASLTYTQPVLAIGLAVVAASTLVIRQALVPRLNAWRDKASAGDEQAKKQFDAGHRLSVLINLAQLAFVGVAFWLLNSR